MTNLADGAARERALDPARSFIVEAPAGSGKTTLLTQRILALLANVEQPESIVAMTFTVKAAEEMRGRVLSALSRALDGDQTLDAQTRRLALAARARSDEKGWRLLDNPRRLRIQTIDSLCANLARRGPLNSGFSREAATLTDPRALYQHAARAAITELGASGVWSESVRTLLRDLDNDWARLESLLGEMLSKREQWLRLVVAAPHRGDFENALSVVVEEEIRAARSLVPAQFHASIVEIGRLAGAHWRREEPDHAAACLADLEALPADNVAALPQWHALVGLLLTGKGTWRRRLDKNDGFPTGDAEAKAAKARALALLQDLSSVPGLDSGLAVLHGAPNPTYTDREWQTIEALFLVLKLAAGHLKVEFELTNTVDFAEVAQAALLALGEVLSPSDLQLLMDYEVQHLLIDEFQDTSIAQFELVERLLGGWTDNDGRSVFLVGDPMQSIYRFRQADVGLFIHTIKSGHIAAVPLEALQLTTNFRSQAGLIDWINDALAAVSAARCTPFADLPRLHAARAATKTPAVQLHGLVDTSEAAEASAVVDLVRTTQTQNPEFSIGILVRSRNHLGVINDQLSAAGIGVSASEIEKLGAQPLVLDLVALTLALLHPADRAAWLSVLRAPWCGWTLQTLTAVFEPRSGQTLWRRLCELDESDPSLLDAGRNWVLLRAVMAAGLRRIGREPVAGIVEDCWLALRGPALYPERNLDHAARYFELLAEYERSETLVTAEGLSALLDRQYVAPRGYANSAVEIMTIHHAKGLEFDVVILPGLGRQPRPDSHRLLEWRQHASAGGSRLLFAPIPRVGQADAPIHRFLRAAEKSEAEAEAYRLLYVAMTRSREVLHLLGTAALQADGTLAPPSRLSFLGMLWPALESTMPFADSATDVAQNGNDQTPMRLRRLVRDDCEFGAVQNLHEQDTAALATPTVEYSWASPVAKHVGTITHALLQLVCNTGLQTWDRRTLESMGSYIDNRLRGFGVERAEVPRARERIVRALVQSLRSERGRWLLGDEHEHAASEFALTAVIDAQPQNIVIDRTFVDAKGTRWIIDYKTGEHVGGELEAFIDSEVLRYQPQLDRYARLLRLQEQRPIRLGLFFPLMDKWREWAFDG